MSEERQPWYERPFTTIRLWGIENNDWGNLLGLIVSDSWSRATRVTHADAEFSDLIERVFKMDQETGTALESAYMQLVILMTEHAAMLGYALAVTYPSSLADLDAWAQRAQDYMVAHS